MEQNINLVRSKVRDYFMAKIGVLGGGSWGTALARLLSNKNYEVDLWARDKNVVKEIQNFHVNSKYLPDVKLPINLNTSIDIEKAISNKDILLLAIPSQNVRDVLNFAKSYIKDNQIIVNVAKGIENNTLLRISQLVKEILPNNNFSVLSGPSHAEEVGLDIPTAIVAASENLKVAKLVQDIFMTPSFRVYTNPDVIGVELGGSLKNVIALGLGISDGLGYGDNTRAALITRGLIEISRLGGQLGANIKTFSGLSGMGDLIVTSTSMLSRNRRAGILIGEGYSIEETIEKVGMVVEGIRTTKSTYELAKKNNVTMPITNEIYEILYNKKDAISAVKNLMTREKTGEIEDLL